MVRPSSRHDWEAEEIVGLLTSPLLDLVDQARERPQALPCGRRGAAREPALDQDRGLPGGLQVLPAIGPLRQEDRARARGTARRGRRAGQGADRQGGRGDPFLHGRGLARGEGWGRLRQRARHGAGRAGAGHGGLRHARHADARPRRCASPMPGSPPTTTTSIPRPSSTARSSRRGPIRTGSTRSATCEMPACRSAAAALSAWARRSRIARGLLQNAGHPRLPIPRACRSTRSCRSPARRLQDQPPVDPLDLVRMVATARILMPTTLRAAVRRALVADPRGADPLLPRRRQLDLLWRQAAHHSQQRCRRRSLFDRGGGVARQAGLRDLISPAFS